MTKRAILLGLLVLLAVGQAFAQVKLEFITPQKTFSFGLSDLFNYSTAVLSDVKEPVYFKGVIKDRSGSILVSYRTQAQEISQGIQIWTESNITLDYLKFSGSDLGVALEQKSSLPPGSYVACIEAIGVLGEKTLGVSCREVTIAPITPPMLMFPSNKLQISNTTPSFTWAQATIGNQTFQPHLRYEVKVVRIHGNQSVRSALRSAVPVVQQGELSELLMPYPPMVEPLSINETYAWRVSAFFKGEMVGQSSPFVFNVGAQEINEGVTSELTYEISSHAKPVMITTTGVLSISLSDYVPTETLDIRIFDGKGNDLTPKGGIESKTNKVVLNLEDFKRVKRGSYYKVNISRGNNGTVSQMFFYQDK